MKVKLALVTMLVLIASCTKKLEETDVLYAKAIKATHKGNFETANTYLGQIDENYPYTEYAKNANILLAYVSYKRKQYSELIPIVDVYIKVNPRDDAVPYLLYIKALTFYDQIKSYKKDKEILYEFANITTIMNQDYPQAKYLPDLKVKNEYVKQMIIAGELNVAIQYQKKWTCSAAIPRYLYVIKIASGEEREIAFNNLNACFIELGMKKDVKEFIKDEEKMPSKPFQPKLEPEIEKPKL